MFLLSIILLALIVYFIFFVAQFNNILFKNYAPFIFTDKTTIKKIISEIKLKDQAIVYELGCGSARFLRFMEKSFSRVELIGVENLFIVYFFNKLKLKLQNSRIKLIKHDCLTINLAQADIIYCYLNNLTMAKLGEKFSKECKPGTQIISRSFSIPQFEPTKTINLKNKNIYFYKI